VQRAYRARLAAAGRVVRIVDAGAVSPAPAGVAQLLIPDFDPAKDGIFERQMVASTPDQLQNALSKLELREEEVTRLRDRNAYLESELKLQERHLTNALKDNIVLKQKLALKAARRR
jgi:K+ transporter